MVGKNQAESRVSGGHPPSTGPAQIVAVVNQKGGVGKTTTAINLASTLALEGRRVLLLDLDPQGNASSGLGIRVDSGEQSIYSALIGLKDLDEIVVATGVENLVLGPSNLDLAGAELEMVSMLNRERQLDRALSSLDESFDIILIDCAPSLGLLTINALVAARHLLIPVQCEYYALEGLSRLMESIERVRSNFNELEILGVLLTMFDTRTKLSADVAAQIRTYFGDKVFRTVIPRSIRLSEAPSYGEPIELYDRMSAGAVAYRFLAQEFLQRCLPARLGTANSTTLLSGANQP
ncbi:MAG: ParA family protein [Acidimicrobiia bacterium]|nr:ParA family protein [bacterium]MXX64502.1 ParA family protein [Acidimicrobiia bacterium]MXZ07522.1 ParA family protein [Acidimicrobiia bacterium]MYD04984.1 ParA family protein [Acidimicrobiia bacterium]MYF26282.1 ParA family protein [Acidimicrobiia bacterium]